MTRPLAAETTLLLEHGHAALRSIAEWLPTDALSASLSEVTPTEPYLSHVAGHLPVTDLRQRLVFAGRIYGLAALGATQVAIASDAGLHVFHVRTRQLEQWLATPCTAVASFGGEVLAATERTLVRLDAKQEIWRVATEGRAPIRAVAVTPQTRHIYAGGSDGILYQSTWEAPREMRLLKDLMTPILSMRPVPDGLVVGREGSLVHLGLESHWTREMSLLLDGNWVGDVRGVQPLGRYEVLTASGHGHVWDWREHHCLVQRADGYPGDQLTAVTALPPAEGSTGDRLVLGCTDGWVVGWDGMQDGADQMLRTHDAEISALEAVGMHVVSGDNSGQVWVHHRDPSEADVGHRSIRQVELHQDQYLTLGAEGTMGLWDAHAELVRLRSLSDSGFVHATVHPIEGSIVASERAGGVTLVSDARLRFEGRSDPFPGAQIRRMAFDPGGTMLACTVWTDKAPNVRIVRWPGLHTLATTVSGYQLVGWLGEDIVVATEDTVTRLRPEDISSLPYAPMTSPTDLPICNHGAGYALWCDGLRTIDGDAERVLGQVERVFDLAPLADGLLLRTSRGLEWHRDTGSAVVWPRWAPPFTTLCTDGQRRVVLAMGGKLAMFDLRDAAGARART